MPADGMVREAVIMRVRERVVSGPEEECVTLEYRALTREFAEIRNYVLHKGETITAFTGDKEAVRIRVEDILYFEAVGELVFAYLESNVYEIKLRLYQVEERLRAARIMRASKSVLLNPEHIVSVRPALNGRLYARMENGEEVLISRHYAKQIADYIMEDEYEGV